MKYPSRMKWKSKKKNRSEIIISGKKWKVFFCLVGFYVWVWVGVCVLVCLYSPLLNIVRNKDVPPRMALLSMIMSWWWLGGLLTIVRIWGGLATTTLQLRLPGCRSSPLFYVSECAWRRTRRWIWRRLFALTDHIGMSITVVVTKVAKLWRTIIIAIHARCCILWVTFFTIHSHFVRSILCLGHRSGIELNRVERLHGISMTSKRVSNNGHTRSPNAEQWLRNQSVIAWKKRKRKKKNVKFKWWTERKQWANGWRGETGEGGWGGM